jgi:hypothetical protein
VNGRSVWACQQEVPAIGIAQLAAREQQAPNWRAVAADGRIASNT